MDTKHAGTKNTFFDASAFDAIARDAAARRVEFMRAHPRTLLAIAGSASMVCGAALLMEIATQDARQSDVVTAGRQYRLEARINAATDQIETLKSALSGTSAISPEVARAIEQQITQPVYDCNQMPCSAALQHRNYAARAQLRSILARKRLPDEAQMPSRTEMENAIK